MVDSLRVLSTVIRRPGSHVSSRDGDGAACRRDHCRAATRRPMSLAASIYDSWLAGGFPVSGPPPVARAAVAAYPATAVGHGQPEPAPGCQ